MNINKKIPPQQLQINHSFQLAKTISPQPQSTPSSVNQSQIRSNCPLFSPLQLQQQVDQFNKENPTLNFFDYYQGNVSNVTLFNKQGQAQPQCSEINQPRFSQHQLHNEKLQGNQIQQLQSQIIQKSPQQPLPSTSQQHQHPIQKNPLHAFQRNATEPHRQHFKKSNIRIQTPELQQQNKGKEGTEDEIADDEEDNLSNIVEDVNKSMQASTEHKDISSKARIIIQGLQLVPQHLRDDCFLNINLIFKNT